MPGLEELNERLRSEILVGRIIARGLEGDDTLRLGKDGGAVLEVPRLQEVTLAVRESGYCTSLRCRVGRIIHSTFVREATLMLRSKR
jgi:hypothetical protein